MKRLYVFYDGECGLCSRCREWLMQSQPAYLELRSFIRSSRTRQRKRICPDLPRFQPDQQLILLSDEGGIYAGENAWLMCLYALRELSGVWSLRLAAPAMKPLAQRLCMLISHNRLSLSNALFRGILEKEAA